MNRRFALIAGPLLLAAACVGERPTLVPVGESSTTTTSSPEPTTAPPAATGPVPAPDGRLYPGVPTDPDALVARVIEVESSIQETLVGDPGFARIAHEQQVLYRRMGRRPELHDTVRNSAPPNLAKVIDLHLTAAAAVGGLGSADQPVDVPAWEIRAPLPADELRTLYVTAGTDTGIDWTYLAAINLLETGYGRIHPQSTTDSQGPMRLPAGVWQQVDDGDIDDPRDAIPAAARYLASQGGPGDMQRALRSYNSSDAYVTAVTAYAELFGTSLADYSASHSWEVYYSTAIGDLWLPVGYNVTVATPAEQYLAQAPWSAPPTSVTGG